MSKAVQGYDPRTGEAVGEPVPATGSADIAAACQAAAAAFPAWSGRTPAERADVLDAVADALDANADELVAIADAETALGAPRLRGEVGRTTGQLRMFGDVLRDGSYLDLILTTPDPAAGLPDVRRMKRALGPVAVFAASNFPFAFSVAGGDTASALAAGCPVVVKAHEGHPRTSVAVASLVSGALRAAGAPDGLFSLVTGFAAGEALVKAGEITAVGFTGSLRGGRALFDLCAQRPDPIPFFGELGSVNPVVVLPGAARARAAEIARGYASSVTMGAGQFCTNPGLLFVPDDDALHEELAVAVAASTGAPMLNGRIHDSYVDGVKHFSGLDSLTPLAEGNDGVGPWAARPVVWRTTLAEFAEHQEQLSEECFGPAGIVVGYQDLAELRAVLGTLRGSLTGSVHAEDSDAVAAAAVAAALGEQVGRVIYNGWPTGVAVCWAMQHGGPWPATTSAGHTSVGATAIDRWLRPVAYQDWPEPLLPQELRTANPLGLPRRVQGSRAG